MTRPEAVQIAKALRARGITREWTITISETSSGGDRWRVVVSTGTGEQAIAVYNARMLQKPIEVAS